MEHSFFFFIAIRDDFLGTHPTHEAFADDESDHVHQSGYVEHSAKNQLLV